MAAEAGNARPPRRTQRSRALRLLRSSSRSAAFAVLLSDARGGSLSRIGPKPGDATRCYEMPGDVVGRTNRSGYDPAVDEAKIALRITPRPARMLWHGARLKYR